MKNRALGNCVSEEVAEKIFAKINGQYMFPESHSHAFAVTAYQAAWLKRYHPVEFFVALVNNQPMGFYPVETLKQDARRFGVHFLDPCVNRSGVDCVPSGDSVVLGLRFVKDVGAASAQAIVEEREQYGPYAGVADLVRRTGLKPQAVESLVMAGAFDSLVSNRRQALWDAGLSIRPSKNGQRSFSGAVNGNVPDLPDFTAHERMAGEYRVMGIYPWGHLMEFVRPGLGLQVLPATAVDCVAGGEEFLVAGWSIALQHPKGQDGTVFVAIEDETGDAQVILWSQSPAKSEAIEQPRATGEGRRFPLGWDHQHYCFAGAGHPPWPAEARRSRLAFRGRFVFQGLDRTLRGGWSCPSTIGVTATPVCCSQFGQGSLWLVPGILNRCRRAPWVAGRRSSWGCSSRPRRWRRRPWRGGRRFSGVTASAFETNLNARQAGA